MSTQDSAEVITTSKFGPQLRKTEACMNRQSVVSEPAKMANQMLKPIPEAEVEEVVMLHLHATKKVTAFSRALYPVVKQPNFWMSHKTLNSFNTCLHLLATLWYLIDVQQL